ncbi:WD repeat, SAM and U-box domain-containing protein 1 isoform 2-T2 [Pholidichthys leucotaenia]
MVSLVCSLRHHSDEVTCCAFSPSLLATGSGDKTIRVYGTADFSELPYSPLSGHGYGVHCCRFSACGLFLLSCSTDGSCIVWRADTGGVTAALQHPGRSPLRVCALAPDSSLLLAGATDGTVALWDFPSRTLRRCSTVSEASVVACCFSPCGQIFVTGCTQGDLKIWDVDIGFLCSQKDAHDLGVTCCTFAPQFIVDGSCVEFRLASCGQDSLLKIWIVSQREGAAYDMKLLHTLTAQSAPVLSCAFSSDGELVVSGSVDKSVAVYNVNLGTLLHTLKQHDRYVTAVAVSPTSPWIATGSMDRTVNVWRIGDGGDTTAPESKETLCQESVGLRGRLLRKIEALKAEQSSSDAPDEFLCPITRELMKDPVIAADGYSYERESMESWIRGKNKTSPMTNLPLQTTLLTPNRSLRMAITRWKSSQ